MLNNINCNNFSLNCSNQNQTKSFWIKYKNTFGNSKWISKLLICIYMIYPGIGITLQLVGNEMMLKKEARVGDAYIIIGTILSIICLTIVVFKFPKNFVYDAWFIKQELKYYLIGFAIMFIITFTIFILYASLLISKSIAYHLRFLCNMLRKFVLYLLSLQV